MKIKVLICLLLIISCNTASFAQTSDNKTEAKASNMREFELSPEAKAAGIDGKLIIDLTIGADGSVSGSKIYGSPMWPCETDPKDEIAKVLKAVKQHLMSAKFEPATKNGKPRSSDVQITFLLSESLKNANDPRRIEENLKKGITPLLVDVKNIQRFAVTIPKQLTGTRNSPSYRITEMQILVDENGDVISAGGLRSGQTELREARKLVCEAKFKPLVLNQKAVKMTGTVVYGLY